MVYPRRIQRSIDWDKTLPINVGDYVIPSSAVRDEGTSYHYLPENVDALSNKGIIHALKNSGEEFKVRYYAGPIWTTDAPYRETKSKIECFQRKRVLEVDTESSAIFSLGVYRRVKVGCMLVASTNLTRSRDSIIGFYNERLEDAMLRAVRICAEVIRDIQYAP